MRLCQFTDPSAWDIVNTDAHGRPIGLSRAFDRFVVSLYNDIDARVWWWSITLPPSHGGGEVAQGTEDSLPHAMRAAYRACVEGGLVATAGTTCRPHSAGGTGFPTQDGR